MGDADQPLAVELHGQTLSISIGVSILKQVLLASYGLKGAPPPGTPGLVEDEYNLACQTVVKLRGDRAEPGIALSMLIAAASRTGLVRFEKE